MASEHSAYFIDLALEGEARTEREREKQGRRGRSNERDVTCPNNDVMCVTIKQINPSI